MKIYILKQSFGSWDDYSVQIHSVYDNKEYAEEVMNQIKDDVKKQREEFKEEMQDCPKDSSELEEKYPYPIDGDDGEKEAYFRIPEVKQFYDSWSKQNKLDDYNDSWVEEFDVLSKQLN